MSEAPVAVGEVLAGKYRIDRVLGQGGMGVVVAATHEELDQKVAIKFLLPAALANAEVVARFQREARAASKIQSEHVARVIDVGKLPSTGAPYMVMEYLEGSDLAQRIAAGPPLPVADAARFLLEACEALAEAHAAGIVHRDIKPANLFLAKRADRTSSVKVLDFGISKAQVGQQGAITSTQAVMGSPYYMSPEQLMSAKHVDHRSDIWSLGIVLYEALVGTPPYMGDQLAEIVAKILQGDTPRVTPHRPDVPSRVLGEVDAILARCLAKDPNGRFKDVGQLAAALSKISTDGARSVERISRVLGSSVPPPAYVDMGTAPTAPLGMMSPLHESQRESRGGTLAISRPTPAQPAHANTSPGWGTTSAGIPPKRNGLWIGLGAAGIALVGGVVLFVALSSRHHEDAAQPPSGVAVSVVTPNIPPPPPLPNEALTGLAIAASAMSMTSSLVPPIAAPPPVVRPTATAVHGTQPPSAKPVASAAPVVTATATATATTSTSTLHMVIK